MKRVLVAVVFLVMLLAWVPKSEAQVWQGNRSQNHQTWRDQHRRHEVRDYRRDWRREQQERRWREEQRRRERERWRHNRWRHDHRRW